MFTTTVGDGTQAGTPVIGDGTWVGDGTPGTDLPITVGVGALILTTGTVMPDGIITILTTTTGTIMAITTTVMFMVAGDPQATEMWPILAAGTIATTRPEVPETHNTTMA